MKKKSKFIIFILASIFIFISLFSIKTLSAKEKIMSIEYYFYNPCKSCNDGEKFAEDLKAKIKEKNLHEEEFKITTRNIAEKENDDLFKKITKDIENSDGLETSVPLLKVNNIFIFGTEAIEKEGVLVIEKELMK